MAEEHTQNLEFGDKFYIVTRQDLTPGQQLAQAMHAALDFTLEYSDKVKRWHTDSNHICIVSARSEEDLIKLAHRLVKNGLHFVAFTEPDLNDELTAIAIEPGKKARKMTSCFPLALKQKGV